MLVKLPVCIVADANSSQDGDAQYITLMEPGGGEYQLTARPRDPEHPCDALARLLPYAQTLQACEVEAEVSGFISHKDGVRKQLLSLWKVTVRPVQLKVEAPPAK